MKMASILFWIMAIGTAVVAQPVVSTAASQPASASLRTAYLDKQGIIRWTDTNDEVSLFGANYCLPSASDYRAAGRVNADRKKIIEQDMLHFARMDFDGLRLSFWGDYENSDIDGNLIANDHLDLLDYLVYQASERGIYMLLSPVVTHSSQWPDAMATKPPGFSAHFEKSELGTNPRAIAAQVNYFKQLLNHVNPYTGRALKDEPAILFIELVNEPWHHSKDVDQSIAYINTLVDAIRSTGCQKLTFHNLSQDFGMADPIARSKVDGVTLGWYPNGLMSGHTQPGNLLRHVDDYPPMRNVSLPGKARIVYEFDAADCMSPCMYPAMARTFRSVGVQFAAMFSYDMMATAPCNLGWQTHYLNLVYTPQKAVSAIIAGEVMRRLPRGQTYGNYPANTRFGDFTISHENNVSLLNSADAFMHAGNTSATPTNASTLRRIVGFGSSPVVRYDGTGSYFLDKIREGLWRLEVYPDAKLINDPFQKPSADKIISQLVARKQKMAIHLPDLGHTFYVVRQDIVEPSTHAGDSSADISPGVYLLSKDAVIDRADLPAKVGQIGLSEFVIPAGIPDRIMNMPERIAPQLVISGDKPQWLLNPLDDFAMLASSRGKGQTSLMESSTARPKSLCLKVAGAEIKGGLKDHTSSLFIQPRILFRADDLPRAVGFKIRTRGLGPKQTLYLTLVERDGTAWSAPMQLTDQWETAFIPITQLKIAKGVLLPQGFPNGMAYWCEPAEGRGGADDAISLKDVERVQFSLRLDPAADADQPYGVEIESLELEFK